MQLKEFIGKACNSKTAFEFIPKKKEKLDLEEIAQKFKNNGIKVIAETPFLLVLRVQEKSVSFFKSGKIMVKETKNINEAKKIVEKIIKII
jgi:TATA-box binding protein (TBP) (component of TFIID and TFIIIB)